MAKTLRLILGDQLNSQHSWFSKKDKEVTYVLMELMQEQEYVLHHVQKIVAFFCAMRCFANQLKKDGHQVIYFYLDANDNRQRFEDNLNWLIQKLHFQKLEYQEPDEYRLQEILSHYANSIALPSKVYDTEHFYTSKTELQDFFKGKKQYLMENFYRYMRRKHHVLMRPDNEPIGEQWNFDHDNRSKYDGKIPLKAPLKFNRDVSELYELLIKLKVPSFGHINAKDFNHPVNREESLQLLQHFTENLLPAFGRYEDAMLKEHMTLFHSGLSFALNVKMLSPKEVIDKVSLYWHNHQDHIPIANVEGFIRQILGWREYMRGIYWAKMPDFKTKNYLNHHTAIPRWFWDGKVKMNCLKHCINNSLENAYAHHIQRLMVIGNFALLAGINPDQVDDWYLGVYIDAIEWVQITNTRGMSQFADGGVVGSKPYVASANYINKMSNYCQGCFYDKNKRVGLKACPFNSLYWNFYLQHQDKLQNNPRIGMMYRLIAKMSDLEIREITSQANQYLLSINEL